MSQESIHVLLTPMKNTTDYDSEIDITDYVRQDSLSEITESLDSEDYDFGLFAFGQFTFTVDNLNGFFNDPDLPHSLFPITRDRAKIRVVFREETVTRNSSSLPTAYSYSDTTLFYGLLTDAATRTDPINNIVELCALTLDSILTTIQISENQIQDGMLASDAIKSILSTTSISTVITYSSSNIVVDQDFTIDDHTSFDNTNAIDSLKTLLIATNSVLYFDLSGTVYVSSRSSNDSLDVLYLYGPFDLGGRENVVEISNYNSGYHRVFNSIFLNGTTVQNDDGSVAEFGLKQKAIDFTYVTDSDTLVTIADRLLHEFRLPKVEMEVVIPLEVGKDVEILQQVSLNYPLKLSPPSGKFFPYFGSSTYASSTDVFPNEVGSFEIDPSMKFKVLERRIDAKENLVTLKLRQDGVEYDEGYF